MSKKKKDKPKKTYNVFQDTFTRVPPPEKLDDGSIVTHVKIGDKIVKKILPPPGSPPATIKVASHVGDFDGDMEYLEVDSTPDKDAPAWAKPSKDTLGWQVLGICGRESHMFRYDEHKEARTIENFHKKYPQKWLDHCLKYLQELKMKGEYVAVKRYIGLVQHERRYQWWLFEQKGKQNDTGQH